MQWRAWCSACSAFTLVHFWWFSRSSNFENRFLLKPSSSARVLYRCLLTKIGSPSVSVVSQGIYPFRIYFLYENFIFKLSAFEKNSNAQNAHIRRKVYWSNIIIRDIDLSSLPSSSSGSFTTKQNIRHYENIPIQIYWKFYYNKNENFQIKNSDIFHINAQNTSSRRF